MSHNPPPDESRCRDRQETDEGGGSIMSSSPEGDQTEMSHLNSSSIGSGVLAPPILLIVDVSVKLEVSLFTDDEPDDEKESISYSTLNVPLS